MLTIILGVKHVFLQPVDYQIFNVKVKGEDLPVVFSNLKKNVFHLQPAPSLVLKTHQPV